jgi:hypothetical protein
MLWDRWRYTNVAALSGVGTDADATSWAAAVVGAGGTVSAARLALVSNLIISLKAQGLWTKIDRLWLFAAENNQSARVDLVGRVTATVVNSPTFTADRGYAGNGTSSYINTGYNPFSNGVAWQLNSAHLGAYNRSIRTDGLSYVDAGANDGVAFAHVYSRLSGGRSGVINDTSGIGTTSPNSSGFGLVTRTGVTANELFYNGVSVGANATASIKAPAVPVFVFARNDGGSPGFLSADQMAALTCGGGLSPAEALAYYNTIQAHMTSIGAQV